MSAFCAVFVWLFQRRPDGRLIATTWVLAAAVSAAIGLVQYFGWAHLLHPWVSQTGLGEAFGNLRQRNQFATLTSIGLVALIALLARRDPAQPIPWPAGLAMALLALGNAASSSRTGLLQWGMIAALSAWWFWPQRRHLLVFALQALLAYGMAVLVLPWVLEATTGHSGGLFDRLVTPVGCSSRKILWSNVLTLIAQKPWFGWGWGELDYAHFITLYPGPRFCEILDNAHNLPLHLAVELGVPVALAFCAGLAWLVWRAKPWHDTDPLRQMAWGVLIVIGLHSLVEYPLWYGPFQIAAALCAALLWTDMAESRPALASPDSADAEAVPPAPSSLRLFVAMLVSLALTGVVLSYHEVSQIYLLPAQRSPAYREDTLNKIRGNWLFQSQARFAELSMATLTPDNAVDVYATAADMLHYSPEPRVIEILIESAVMLGQEDEALDYMIRYRAAFPAEHARWSKDM
jgi:O-antigen ligase